MGKTIEDHRAGWAKIAKQWGWYFEPFYIQVWQTEDGAIIDSLAHRGMEGATEDQIIICPSRKK